MADVVIVGGGHNGLTAAFYLAKAGLKPLVLEKRDTLGGGAITTEIHPGYRCPTLSHHTPLWKTVVSEMELARHGLEFLTPATQVFAPAPDGRAVTIYDDPRRTADGLRAHSAKDAEAYPAYRESMQKIAGVLASLLATVPPDIDSPSASDVWGLLKTGRRFRALGRRDGYRLLRWGPMALADLMHEWFETDLLAAAIAGPGVSGTMLGPWSAGSALVLLLQEANAQLAGGTRVKGGPGAIAAAMAAAARAAGAEIRTGTAVHRIVTKDDRVTGVVLDNGEQVAARAVVSAVDPKTTFLKLVDPTELMPDFVTKVRNYRAAGTIAKMNLALSALPAFTGADVQTLSGRIHIGPEIDYLEKAFDHAKYGEFSSRPWLDITIPSIADPQLAPAGAHVMSIYVHYAPFKLRSGSWDAEADRLGETVLATLEDYAPGLRSLVVGGHVIDPAQLESDYGFFGGHPYHGEVAIDQLFTMRPLLGHARYSTPVAGLHLCSAGTHPGAFLTGGSGRQAARQIVGELKK